MQEKVLEGMKTETATKEDKPLGKWSIAALVRPDGLMLLMWGLSLALGCGILWAAWEGIALLREAVQILRVR